jgi:hypothetical protein
MLTVSQRRVLDATAPKRFGSAMVIERLERQAGSSGAWKSVFAGSDKKYFCQATSE